MVAFIVLVLISYLLGSIPSSVWIGKMTKGIDVRDHGSGNAGATNTFRVLGWKAGTVVVIIDFFKGLTATVVLVKFATDLGGLPEYFTGENEIYFRIILGMVAVIGHTLPVFAQFKGGKGMLTAGGMLVGVEPISISFALSTYVIVLLVSRYSSLASIVAATSYPIYLAIMKFALDMEVNPVNLIFAVLLCIFLVSKHRANIKRLLAGTESRIASFRPSKKEKTEGK